MAGYAGFLILILKSKRDRGIPKSFLEIILEVVKTQRKLMCRMGCLAASFTFLHKCFLCILRAYFKQSFHSSFPFFSGCKSFIILNNHSFCLYHDPASLLSPSISQESPPAPILDPILRMPFQISIQVQKTLRERFPEMLSARKTTRWVNRQPMRGQLEFER